MLTTLPSLGETQYIEVVTNKNCLTRLNQGRCCRHDRASSGMRTYNRSSAYVENHDFQLWERDRRVSHHGLIWGSLYGVDHEYRVRLDIDHVEDSLQVRGGSYYWQNLKVDM